MPHQPVTGPAATAADLAAQYHVTIRTTRRWASEDNWRRTITRPVRYSLDDADASYRKRRASHPRPPGLTSLTTLAP